MSVKLAKFVEKHPHYRIDRDQLLIEINREHPTLKRQMQLSDKSVSTAAINSITFSAYAELLARDEIARLGDEGQIGVVDSSPAALMERFVERRTYHESRLLEEFGARMV